jgi:SAM-dependent methyltransferase
MLIRLIIKLAEAFPWLKRVLSRHWYRRLATEHKSEAWTFMNYGYASVNGGQPPLSLLPADEPDRYTMQHYHYIAGRIALEGLDVLEVGSGRGGGAAFVHRHFKPRQMTGVDFAEEAVRFSNRRHGAPGLTFVAGDAESLPFDDASFDAVLNVESSHCYASVPAFLGQVRRVLRPGGHFLFADLRRASKRDLLHRHMLESGMDVLDQEDITANVLEALRLDSERKAALIAQVIDKGKPAALNAFREFACVEGTRNYEAVRNRDIVYWRYLLRKPFGAKATSVA